MGFATYKKEEAEKKPLEKKRKSAAAAAAVDFKLENDTFFMRTFSKFFRFFEPQID